MEIRLYNTLTRTKEVFQPLEPGRVRMYVCGITAYDRCHIGHARSAIVFDAIVRYLQGTGFEVTFIRNFTDIDDKIIARANQEGMDSMVLAEREIGHFYEDMDRLGVLHATFEPKATEHIQEIIDMIHVLIQKGHAYEAEGDVYFAVRTFLDYGKLSNRKLDELKAGARIEPGEKKKDPLDFALWKAAKPKEPFWESPWGKGRPGWHIECSAMSRKYLGDTFDIHGGGLDLIFPHHENEIAQSEAATGKPFARYWLHNGFVTINGEKMSKSLGNFITIQEILTRHHPETLRLFLLSKHYRSPLDYSEEAVSNARTALWRIYSAIIEARRFESTQSKKERPVSETAKVDIGLLNELEGRFMQHMSDDFNTAGALGAVFEGVKAMNRLMQEAARAPSKTVFTTIVKASETIQRLGRILGLLQQDPSHFIHDYNMEYLARNGLSETSILASIEKRAMARTQKDWATADAIRNELEAQGIALQDTLEGTTWTVREQEST
ncbi:MAG: cysteine--tRNA ligase [Dissulfuribacterales bacterium]